MRCARRLAVAIIAGLVLALPAAAQRAATGPQCSQFELTGDHLVDTAQHTLDPIVGDTRLTFVCAGIGKLTTPLMHVEINIGASFFLSGGLMGDSRVDPALLRGNSTDKMTGPPVRHDFPAASCIFDSSALKHSGTCGYDPGRNGYVDGTYALYWRTVDGTGQAVSSCNLLISVKVTVTLANKAPLDIGDASVVRAGCHVPGSPAGRVVQKSNASALIRAALLSENSAKAVAKLGIAQPKQTSRNTGVVITDDLEKAERQLEAAIHISTDPDADDDLLAARDLDREAASLMSEVAGNAQLSDAQRVADLKKLLPLLAKAEAKKNAAIAQLSH